MKTTRGISQPSYSLAKQFVPRGTAAAARRLRQQPVLVRDASSYSRAIEVGSGWGIAELPHARLLVHGENVRWMCLMSVRPRPSVVRLRLVVVRFLS